MWKYKTYRMCKRSFFRETFHHLSDVVVYPYFPIMIYSHKPLLTFLRNICHIHKKETRESSHNHAKSIDSIWRKMRFLLHFHTTHKRYISHRLSSLLLLVVCIIVMLKLLWSLFEHNSINQVERICDWNKLCFRVLFHANFNYCVEI